MTAQPQEHGIRYFHLNSVGNPVSVKPKITGFPVIFNIKNCYRLVKGLQPRREE